MSRITTLFLNEDGYKCYWDKHKVRKILNEYIEKEGKNKDEVYKELSDKCIFSYDTVKNWFSREKNGPSDEKSLKTMAEYFNVKYSSFLSAFEKRGKGVTDVDYEVKSLTNCNMRKGLFDVKGLRFIGMLNRLAKESKNGYKGFSEYGINDDFEGVVFIDREGPNYGKVILDMCVDEIHHDVVSTYNDYIDGIEYDVRVDEEDGYCIVVSGEQDLYIVIDDGEWYFC